MNYNKKEIEQGAIPYGAECYDCSKPLKKGKNCATYFVEDKDDEVAIFKCQDCYAKDKTLHYHSQDVDCYSRIVGYYSPHNRWNAGKDEERSDRKMFNLNK